MPESTVPQEPQPLQEGDPVIIIDGTFRGKIGKLAHIGKRNGFFHTTPICLVTLDSGTFAYLRDEIEPVESEVGNG